MLDLSCLRRSQDKLAVLIEITVSERLITPLDIQAVLSRSEYSDYLVSEEAISEAVSKFAELKEEPGLAESWGETFVKIASLKNAEIGIDISEDKMAVWATITAAYGGAPISNADLVNAMREAGVCFGLQKRRATELLEMAKKATPGQKIRKVVALGRKPIDGEDSRFERFVETPSERLRQPVERDDGTVDMRDLGSLETVSPGVELMRRHPHSLGQAGRDVCGEVLPHYEGQEIPFTVGEGTTIAVDDPNLLLSAAEGLPLEIENGMKVDDVLTIKTVDVGYGHVDFSGTVLITGNVGEGMKVKASGDVHVNGFVESAQIESGGDVVIGKGIIGHRLAEGSEDYSCSVKAQGMLQATFAQYSKLEVEKDVTVTSQMLHSKVVTKGKVTVQDANGFRGTLVGGKIEAGGAISTVILGATAGTATELTIQGNIKDIQSEKAELNNAKYNLQERISKVLDAQMRFSSGKDTDPETLKKLGITLNHAKQELTQVDFALDHNQQEEQTFFSNARLVVRKEMHPNVRLDIAGFKLFTTREYGPTESIYEEGRLNFEPLAPGKK